MFEAGRILHGAASIKLVTRLKRDLNPDLKESRVMKISLAGSGSETLLSDFDSSGVKYIRHSPPIGIFMNSAGDTIQILKDINEMIPWGLIATVLVAWLKYRPSRKVIITQDDNKVFHAEGLSVEEIERLLPQSKNIMVIETIKPEE